MDIWLVFSFSISNMSIIISVLDRRLTGKGIHMNIISQTGLAEVAGLAGQAGLAGLAGQAD